MAELYTHSSYNQRSASQYPLSQSNNVVYNTNSIVPPPQQPQQQSQQQHPNHSAPPPPTQPANNGSNNNNDNDDSDSGSKSAETSPVESKPPQKTQSTFLTKLYSYVRPPFMHRIAIHSLSKYPISDCWRNQRTII